MIVSLRAAGERECQPVRDAFPNDTLVLVKVSSAKQVSIVPGWSSDVMFASHARSSGFNPHSGRFKKWKKFLTRLLVFLAPFGDQKISCKILSWVPAFHAAFKTKSEIERPNDNRCVIRFPVILLFLSR